MRIKCEISVKFKPETPHLVFLSWMQGTPDAPAESFSVQYFNADYFFGDRDTMKLPLDFSSPFGPFRCMGKRTGSYWTLSWTTLIRDSDSEWSKRNTSLLTEMAPYVDSIELTLKDLDTRSLPPFPGRIMEQRYLSPDNVSLSEIISKFMAPVA